MLNPIKNTDAEPANRVAEQVNNAAESKITLQKSV